MLCLILLPETLPNYTINYRRNNNFVKTSLILSLILPPTPYIILPPPSVWHRFTVLVSPRLGRAPKAPARSQAVGIVETGLGVERGTGKIAYAQGGN